MPIGSMQTVVNSRSIVDKFYAAKGAHDLEGLAALFADDVVYVFPLPASGAQEDWFRYDGTDATMAYQRRTSEALSQLRMLDREMTVSEDGGTVFVECRGDYVTADGRPYRNIYMFKFTINGGLIKRVREYCNPVTYAVLAGLPIANSQIVQIGEGQASS